MKHVKILILTLITLNYFGLTAQSNFIGSGISMNFEGADADYLDAGDNFNDLNYPFTVEAWVYVNEYTFPYSCIFASDNPAVNYYGFWFQLNASGELRVELGDGSGAGSSDRRGRESTTSVPMNQWVHVAVTCNSATDMTFYMNGIALVSVATDGTASVPLITHNSDHARIGNLDTPFDFHPFNGQIDELRVWNDVRTVSELRDYMCQKLTGAESNLIGYWIADESYFTETVDDYSATGADATIIGSVEKITSGAPIGNASVNLYTASWFGIKMTILTDNNDFFRIKKIENNPKGMHIYRIDANPYYTDGLAEYPDYYFGVFQVDDAIPAQYGISYKFTYSNGVVTPDNEEFATLYFKNDGSVESWTNLDAVIDAADPFIRKVGNTTRKEVVFNIDGPGIVENGDGNNKESSIEVNFNIYPNPATGSINFSGLKINDMLLITDINGNVLEKIVISDQELINISTLNYPAGNYLATIIRENSVATKKFIIIN